MIRRSVPFVVLAFLAAGLVPAQCGLTTTYTGSTGQDGVMFDVMCLNPAGITITSIEINLSAGTHNMEIWARTNANESYVGFESSNVGWTLLGAASVVSNGANVPTPLPIPLGLMLGANEVRGLYVTNDTTTTPNTLYSTGVVSGTLIAQDTFLQIFAGNAGVYFSATIADRMFNGTINYTYPGQVIDWQVNSAALGLSLDGVQATPCSPVQVVKPLYACTPVTPVTGFFNISSNLPGSVYDIVASAAALVPGSAGGIPLPDGQVVNLNLLAPFSFVGATAPGGMLVVPSFFPGATEVSIDIPFSLAAPGVASYQGVIIDPSALLGFRLTQGNQLDVQATLPPTSVPGPTSTTGVVSLDVTSPPTCWSAAGVPFYGTIYTQIHVTANGFVSFGGTDTDTSPTTAEALADDGRVGFWTDLDPSEGGTITITNPAPEMIQVDWSGVFYNTGGPGISFSILFDCLSGTIVVDGLQGIAANPGTATTDDQWLGICAGLAVASTDPGPAGFGLGLNGVAAVETDALYEFNDTSATLSGLPASIVGGMNTLTFVPAAVGLGINYSWAGN